MAHKRYFPMKASNPVLAGLVKAHRRHHQRVDQEGQGPWGSSFIATTFIMVVPSIESLNQDDKI